MILPWTLAIWAHRTHARSCSCSYSYSFTYSYSYSSWQTGDYPTGFNTASATHCMHIFGFIVYMDKDLFIGWHTPLGSHQSRCVLCGHCKWTVHSQQSTVHGTVQAVPLHYAASQLWAIISAICYSSFGNNVKLIRFHHPTRISGNLIELIACLGQQSN